MFMHALHGVNQLKTCQKFEKKLTKIGLRFQKNETPTLIKALLNIYNSGTTRVQKETHFYHVFVNNNVIPLTILYLLTTTSQVLPL